MPTRLTQTLRSTQSTLMQIRSTRMLQWTRLILLILTRTQSIQKLTSLLRMPTLIQLIRMQIRSTLMRRLTR
ncbi:hypothetical protein D3C75_1079810 [compost metagenome]